MHTFVTALYDIGRGQIDSRHIDEYITWTNKTLELKDNFIVFTTEDIAEKLHKRDNIIFITEDIPLINFKSGVEEVLNSAGYLSKIYHPNRIECKTPLYNIIQYSKFKWLERSIKDNPFSSEYFFWIDAGCSRFFPNDIYNKTFSYENLSSEKFLIQGNVNTSRINIDENYKYKADCVLVGTLFGGGKRAVEKISKATLDLFIQWLKNEFTNNEQIALAYIAREYSEIFDIYIGDFSKHLPLLDYLYE
jgi:hypothetical protein